MKKVLSVSICFVLLLVTFVVTLTGCGSESGGESDSAFEVENSQVGELTTQTIDEQFNGSANYNSTVSNTLKCMKCGADCKIGQNYCSSHKCFDYNCNLENDYGSAYCINHKCMMCNLGKESDSPYCSQHKCSSCNNVVVEGSHYCVAHKCLLCDNKAIYNGYCSTHD